jgi:2-polyprenyl-3-methyl-5-hydroxy-6-metoxy-1,4-benzoquinol methylase
MRERTAVTPSITEQKKFYDKFWGQQDRVKYLQTARCGAILTALSGLELWDPRILDFGCGNGWLTAILSMCGETVGADLCADIAAERFPGIQFIAADFNDWQPKLDPFDVVVSQEVIEHLEDQKRYLDLAANLLKRGGYIILTTPNACVTEAWRGTFVRQPIENVLTAHELRQLLKGHFEVVSLRTILVGPGKIGPTNSWTGILLTRLGLIRAYDRLLELCGFGLHIVAVARKL